MKIYIFNYLLVDEKENLLALDVRFMSDKMQK